MRNIAVLVEGAVLLTAMPASADFCDDDAFQRTWTRTDRPALEPYAESPEELRAVIYFD